MASLTATHPGRLRVRRRGARRSRREQKACAGAFGSRAGLRPTAPVRKVRRAGLLARSHLLALTRAVRARTSETHAALTPRNSPGVSRATTRAPRLLRATDQQGALSLAGVLASSANRSGWLHHLLSGRSLQFPVAGVSDLDAWGRCWLLLCSATCMTTILLHFALVLFVAIVFYFGFGLF